MQRVAVLSGVVLVLLATVGVAAGQQAAPPSGPAARSAVASSAVAPTLPPGYVVGPADLLSIVFWRDKEMSADVVVRPDGKISLPLLNDIQAAGLTPDQLRATLVDAASKYVEEPNATVVVKEVRSRNVFITGNVAKPATYPLNDEMSVLQLIAVAGGLLEYADSKNIVIIRTSGGQQNHYRFNYNDVVRQRHPAQNLSLKPGDTVVVP